MTDALPNNLRGIVWSATFAAVGAVSGVLIEGICQKALRDQSVSVRGAIQFVIGVATIGPVMQTLIPSDTQSPIGDGLLMVFFYWFQPLLMADLGVWLKPIQKMLWKDVPVADRLALHDRSKLKNHHQKNDSSKSSPTGSGTPVPSASAAPAAAPESVAAYTAPSPSGIPDVGLKALLL